jgi:hypothetical protein
LPPPPDDFAFLALAGIDDLFLEATTVGALHRGIPRRGLLQVGRGEGELLPVQGEGAA